MVTVIFRDGTEEVIKDATDFVWNHDENVLQIYSYYEVAVSKRFSTKVTMVDGKRHHIKWFALDLVESAERND